MTLYHLIYSGYKPSDSWVEFTGLSEEECIEYLRQDECTFDCFLDIYWEDLESQGYSDEEIEKEVEQIIKTIDSSELLEERARYMICTSEVPWEIKI